MGDVLVGNAVKVGRHGARMTGENAVAAISLKDLVGIARLLLFCIVYRNNRVLLLLSICSVSIS